jgi:hypothetical protein
MARDLNKVAINRFLGLGLNGEAVSRPIRQTSDGWGLLFARAKNVHTPYGKLTNKDIGCSLISGNTATGGKDYWGVTGFASRTDSDRRLAEFITQTSPQQRKVHYYDGAAWQVVTGASVITGARCSWVEWIPLGLAGAVQGRANGTVGPFYYVENNGTIVEKPWFIETPNDPLVLNPTGSGSLGAATGWKYTTVWIRDTYETWASPPNFNEVDTGSFGNAASVDITLTPPPASEKVDSVEIYRTTDGGNTYRYLATVSAGTTLYSDTTTDDNLSLIELDGFAMLDNLKFNIWCHVGDRIYMADIYEEAGDIKRRANRVRWTYPGKPWRADILDFTDEVPDPVIGMVEVENGVMAFTIDAAYYITHLGNGVHKTEPARLPGCGNFRGVTKLSDGIAWADQNGIYELSRSGGFADISDQPGGPSIRQKYGALSSRPGIWDNGFLFYYKPLDYLCVAYQQFAASLMPDTLLVYDRQRKAWWEVDYANCKLMGVFYPDYDNEQDVWALTFEGDTVKLFDTETVTTTEAGTTPLVPLVEPNPLDMLSADQKRFRAIQVITEVVAQVDMSIEWFLDGQRLNRQKVFIEQSPGDLLDSTFVLDESELAGESFAVSRFPINKRGDYLSFIVQETDGVDIVNIQRIDIEYQESPRRLLR